jgi:type I restriction-modification system DNA methylase subunit
VDTLVRILEPRPGDTVYDPTSGSGGMLVHTADHRNAPTMTRDKVADRIQSRCHPFRRTRIMALEF